ncbi:MAG: hypothetical protein ABIC91_00720 [Nanoarchaeota archaeon]|nr:hypothetical protein [Nanoarchaeota archaeon]MBU1029894.1 hypothetical protein [Nanoarchaeota archaeon]
MHLDSINQNTNEIQGNYEYLLRLEAKVDKLSEKVDDLQMQVNPHFYNDSFDNISLSPREEEVFVVIYSVDEGITVDEIARKLGLTKALVERYVNSLIFKKIPVVRRSFDNEYLSLEYNFKDLQARKNILKLNGSATQRLVSKEAI